MLSALAKCELRMAFELPPATPHMVRKTLEAQKNGTRNVFGSTGLQQSRIMAISLKMSAASLYILHSASILLLRQCAKRIVAILPTDSCSTLRSMAAVAEAFS